MKKLLPERDSIGTLFSINDCGLMLEPQEGMEVEEIVEWAKYAEKSGYGYIFRSDHILATSHTPDTVATECWVTLGIIAASTSKINFGPMVSPVGFRNPALLARMALTIHSFSKGRLILSLGTGWNQEEYAAHGLSFPKFRARLDELKEATHIIKPLIDGNRVDFDGKHFSAHLEVFPRPHGGKMRLVMGGRSPKIVSIIGKYADEWNIFNSPTETYLKLKEVLEKGSGGRKVEISQMSAFLIADSKTELHSKISKHMEGRARFLRPSNFSSDPERNVGLLRARGMFVGTPDEIIAQIDERRKLGIERFYFQVLDPEDKEMVHVLTDTLKNKI